ncbi:hypothetical protein R3W88_015775 [Solanum pinnatisectum]|uniref:Uncharacterized protein n=1 Tax=Solanum pinnatisectum TaxID=50273 RepID=A0AAV9KWK9_9SOLN|nr:hypothetical protein R3W88_015775 [Solanum pinnatisectum]
MLKIMRDILHVTTPLIGDCIALSFDRYKKISFRIDLGVVSPCLYKKKISFRIDFV